MQKSKRLSNRHGYYAIGSHCFIPRAAEREAIWRRAIPEQTPTHGLDAARLAQLNMPGGNIRNIALNAAFLAAEQGRPLGMAHLREAATLEAGKVERPIAAVETRGWE